MFFTFYHIVEAFQYMRMIQIQNLHFAVDVDTNTEAGHGLLRMGGFIVPFVNTIPRQTELYKLMTTTPGENLT